MRLDVDSVYVIVLKNGRRFSAKLVEQGFDRVCFLSSSDIMTEHNIDEIAMVRKVTQKVG